MSDIPSSAASSGVAKALATLGGLSLRDLSVESLLQTITDLACTIAPGEPEASVTLVVRSKPTTVSSSGELARDLDDAQYARGVGPCLHAATTGETVEIRDARTDDRWGDYGERAAARGSLSSLSIPLRIDPTEHVHGGLNIYARPAHAFDPAARAAAVAFGSYAAVAAGNLHAYRQATEAANNLQVALESRAVIDQAKGTSWSATG